MASLLKIFYYKFGKKFLFKCQKVTEIRIKRNARSKDFVFTANDSKLDEDHINNQRDATHFCSLLIAKLYILINSHILLYDINHGPIDKTVLPIVT